MTTIETLLARVQDYLGNGGFFNPEMMDHWNVRVLVIDMAKELQRVAAQASPPTDYASHEICQSCAVVRPCHIHDARASPPTPMARMKGALRGDETDEQFDAAVRAIREPASPPTLHPRWLAQLKLQVERDCRFNCDAESSCDCGPHQAYRLALSVQASPPTPDAEKP